MRQFLPPTHSESRADIPPQFILDGHLRLDRNGQWFLPNGMITHPKLRLFLFKNLWRNREGQYWVVNGPQRVTVNIEDTPFFVLAASHQDAGIVLDLCDQSQELLRPEYVFVGPDHAFYTKVKFGQQGDEQALGHWARFSRAASHQLAAYIVEDNKGYALNLGNKSYPITSVQRSNRGG